jgi:RimJ/RimL family protein N-acetyltransferase
MILAGFGVVLKRITRDDIEQIRRWRNQDFVRDQMFHQELITETQQNAWFDSVNNRFNYYFVIHVDELPIGLIYAKQVNPETMVGEGGIFIGEPAYLTSDTPARASLLLLYFCFNKLSLSTSLIRVKESNLVALRYNELLGYVVQQRSGEELLLSLTKEDFQRSNMVSRVLRLLETESIQLTGLPSKNNLDQLNALLKSNR